MGNSRKPPKSDILEGSVETIIVDDVLYGKRVLFALVLGEDGVEARFNLELDEELVIGLLRRWADRLESGYKYHNTTLH